MTILAYIDVSYDDWRTAIVQRLTQLSDAADKCDRITIYRMRNTEDYRPGKAMIVDARLLILENGEEDMPGVLQALGLAPEDPFAIVEIS